MVVFSFPQIANFSLLSSNFRPSTIFPLIVKEMVIYFGCGIDVGGIRISLFLYADDIVLLTERVGDMQSMLNVLYACMVWQGTKLKRK